MRNVSKDFKEKTSIKRIWRIFIGVLIKPKEVFETTFLQWKEALVYLLVFFVLSATTDQLQNIVYNHGARWKEILFTSFFTIFYIWILLSLVFQLVAWAFKGKENLFTIMGSMGYTVIPLILLATIELVFTLLLLFGAFPMSGKFVDLFPKILSWIGIGWAWPGILCIYMLENIYHFGYKKAITMLGITWALVVAAWFLPG